LGALPKPPLVITERPTEDFSGAYRFVGTLNDCPGSFDPVCRRAVLCPEPTDPIPPGSSSVTPGTFPPAGFCPTGTGPGGITATCSSPVVGYTRSTSPQP